MTTTNPSISTFEVVPGTWLAVVWLCEVPGNALVADRPPDASWWRLAPSETAAVAVALGAIAAAYRGINIPPHIPRRGLAGRWWTVCAPTDPRAGELRAEVAAAREAHDREVALGASAESVPVGAGGDPE